MTLTFLIWSKVLELKMLNFAQVLHKFDVWQLVCQLEKCNEKRNLVSQIQST